MFFSNILKYMFYRTYYVFWESNKYKRIHISKTAILNNALLNVNSWTIVIKEHVFFWHNVCILTWTHNYNKFYGERKSFPKEGCDIIIEKWVRVWSNVTIIWPCIIWKNAVIASWAVVTKNVAPYTIVWWVPAKLIKKIKKPLD